jgi:signal transduction histidine kinase
MGMYVCVVCVALIAEDMPPAITEDIKTIHESVELDVQLIDDLLDLTKVAPGKLQLHSQELSAHELLGRTLQIVAHDIANKELNVGVDPRASGDRIVADPARLQQVFWNIIQNAIKFTPKNGSIIIRTSNYEVEEEVEEDKQQQQQQHSDSDTSPTRGTVLARHNTTTTTTTAKSQDDSGVSVDLQRKMKSSGNGKGSGIIARRKVTRKKVMLRVEVQDTGIGIEANVIPHLFHAFEQGDSSITLHFGGLGLGHAISRSLVEMHSGALSADSEGKDKGATFTIVLPTIHTSTPSPQLAAASASMSSSASSARFAEQTSLRKVALVHARLALQDARARPRRVIAGEGPATASALLAHPAFSCIVAPVHAIGARHVTHIVAINSWRQRRYAPGPPAVRDDHRRGAARSRRFPIDAVAGQQSLRVAASAVAGAAGHLHSLSVDAHPAVGLLRELVAHRRQREPAATGSVYPAAQGVARGGQQVDAPHHVAPPTAAARLPGVCRLTIKDALGVRPHPSNRSVVCTVSCVLTLRAYV